MRYLIIILMLCLIACGRSPQPILTRNQVDTICMAEESQIISSVGVPIKIDTVNSEVVYEYNSDVIVFSVDAGNKCHWIIYPSI